jgi:hypothetical protein
MRVVGIALMVSVLCAACAIQPADGADEASLGSPTTPAATAGGVHVVVPGTVQVHDGAQTGDPPGAPSPCSGTGCDPQPQPWGGRPPSYVPTAKQ